MSCALTVEDTDSIDVVLVQVQVLFVSGVVWIHDCCTDIGVTQAQSMAELVRGHLQQVLPCNNVPVFSCTVTGISTLELRKLTITLYSSTLVEFVITMFECRVTLK